MLVKETTGVISLGLMSNRSISIHIFTYMIINLGSLTLVCGGHVGEESSQDVLLWKILVEVEFPPSIYRYIPVLLDLQQERHFKETRQIGGIWQRRPA